MSTAWPPAAARVLALLRAAQRLGMGLAGWPWRRIALGSGAAAFAVTAFAASQVWLGYSEYPAEFWAKRLQERLGSPVYSSDGQLHGTLFPARASASGLNFADYGYVRVDGDIPPLWTEFVKTLEQQTLFNRWRTVCGIDPLGIVKRVFTGTGGGSGLAEQNAKNLIEPEVKRSPHRMVQWVQKMRSWGTACSLHQAQGGDAGMLRLYASYAPVGKVNGTLRGEEAGARVLFNRAPSDAAAHQLALLVAMAQKPFDVAPPSAFDKGCAALRNAAKEPLTADERKARNQCFNIARARVAVQRVMEGEARDAEVAALNALELTGIQPANPFAPLPTHRLLNLSARTQAALGTALLQHVADEAEQLQLPAGQALTLTMAQPEQTAFGREARDALRRIDESLAGRESLCVPLWPGTPLRQCPSTPEVGARADVVLARMSVEHGTLQRLYESSRIAFGASNAVGSVGKMIIALAAVRAGYTAATPVCPRQARDGDRLLRRVTRPEHGYAVCGPAQLISFAEAQARSDNLAAYDVARALGPQALRRAIEAVGLTPDPDPRANLAYQLAFGTQAGTPEQLLALGQALFGAAYELPVRNAGPRVLVASVQPATAHRAVLAMLPSPSQRLALRELLQAPVTHPAGTLHHLAGPLAAGKTGTTSAAHLAPWPGARAYVQAKYTLAYAPADRSVVLSIISAPAGHALGLHHLRGETLAPAISALLKPARGG